MVRYKNSASHKLNSKRTVSAASRSPVKVAASKSIQKDVGDSKSKGLGHRKDYNTKLTVEGKSSGQPQDERPNASVCKIKVLQGHNILREIRALQKGTKILIPKVAFARLVRETMANLNVLDLKIQSAALAALQEATEMYLVNLFQDAYCCSLHARRVTLLKRDIQLVRKLRGNCNLQCL